MHLTRGVKLNVKTMFFGSRMDMFQMQLPIVSRYLLFKYAKESHHFSTKASYISVAFPCISGNVLIVID